MFKRWINSIISIPCGPYPLLLIKYELKLPSEATPGLLSFRFRSKQSAMYKLYIIKFITQRVFEWFGDFFKQKSTL